MPYILDNLRWVADYFVKAHTAPNELWGQVGNGSVDHAWWGPAEAMTMQRPSYKLDASCPGSDLAGEAAAALAAASLVFTSTDATYANVLLSHAVELYEFANTYRGKYSDCITDAQAFYNSWSGYNDELVWAAAWLYVATNDSQYLSDAEGNFASIAGAHIWTHAWDDKSYGSYVLLATATGKAEYVQDAEDWLDFWTVGFDGKRIHYTPGGLAWLDQWGSLRYAANTAFLALIYSSYLESVGGNADKVARYHDFAVRQIDYMLGDNPGSRSFVVGYGKNPPINPHHRTAHGSWSNNITEPPNNRHVLYGALVGGPDNGDNYSDDRNNYINNEVATDYNAGFTGALAAMVAEFGGSASATFPPEEPRDDEFFVEARVNSSGPRYVEISGVIHNRSAWPARPASDLSFRYYVDLSEVFAAGYSLADVTVSTGYSQGSGISALTQHGTGDIYYVEISFAGVEILPAGQSEHKREVQFRLSLPTHTNENEWDSSNDFSYQGLSSSSRIKTERIPVYDGGNRLFGVEP